MGPRLPRDWVACAVVVWAILLTGIATRVLVWPHLHTVFPILAGAAQDWLHGRDLYLVEESKRPGLDHFRYSPLVAALLVPFGVPPQALGGVLWRLLNAGVFLGGLHWWSRVATPFPLTRVSTAALFLLVLPLTVTSLNNGQSNPLVIGLLLAAVAAVRQERWNWASACVALACMLKLYPLAIGLLLVVLHPRQLGVRLFGALAAGFALPFLLQRPDYVTEQYGTWLYLLWADDRRFLPITRGYQDLWMLVRAWHIPLGPEGYRAVQLAAAGMLALLCFAGRRAAWPAERQLGVVLVFGTWWMTLLGPATESSTYALLAPALAWTVLEAWHTPRPFVLRFAVGVSFALFVGGALAGWLPWRATIRSWGVYPLAGSVLGLGMAGMHVQDWLRWNGGRRLAAARRAARAYRTHAPLSERRLTATDTCRAAS